MPPLKEESEVLREKAGWRKWNQPSGRQKHYHFLGSSLPPYKLLVCSCLIRKKSSLNLSAAYVDDWPFSFHKQRTLSQVSECTNEKEAPKDDDDAIGCHQINPRYTTPKVVVSRPSLLLLQCFQSKLFLAAAVVITASFCPFPKRSGERKRNKHRWVFPAIKKSDLLTRSRPRSENWP